MSQIKRNKKLSKSKFDYLPKEIFNFFLLTFSLLFTLSIISYDPSDPNFFQTGLGSTINNYIGIIGSYISHMTFMTLGKTSYLLAAFLIFYSLSKYRTFIPARRAAVTNFFLLIIFFSSLSTVLEYITSSSGGYIGHIIFNYSSSYIGSYGVLVAAILTLLYSYVYYFDISVSSVFRNTIKVVTYLYLKAKYKLGILYEKASLKISLLRQRNTDSSSITKKKPNDTKVDLVKLKPQESKRAFK